MFAGSRVRRVRLARGLTQTRMASDLGVSVSYLNLIERDQRPLSASFLLRLASTYDLDLKVLTGDHDGALADGLTPLFAGPLLSDLGIGRAELRDLALRSPGIAQAILRLAEPVQHATAAPPPPTALDAVDAMLADHGNYFDALDRAAERLADELRLDSGDLATAAAERLRARHAILVRVLPADVLPGLSRRLDLHMRQLQLSEALDASSRGFAAAVQLAHIELKDAIGATLAEARLPDGARHAGVVALGNYAAAAMLMPYARFLAACESTGYDVEILQARFGRGLEQIAHRLTTLGRPGARGVPFFLVRIDRAGNVSKRFAPGPSPLPPEIPGAGGCALWNLHAAFDSPGHVLRELVEMEDGRRWLTLARTVRGAAAPFGQPRAEFAIGIGCDAAHAHGLAWSAGVDLAGPATPIGPGCAACHRPACRQRSLPPAGERLAFDERLRPLAPFPFAQD